MIFGDRIAAGLPRILVPANEDPGLIRFATKVAKAHNAALLLLYVQPRPEPGAGYVPGRIREPLTLANDPTAKTTFKAARAICEAAGVPVLQIYAIHNCPGEMMLDHAATWGVDAVVMGATRKHDRRPVGNNPALQKVYTLLPPSIPLIIHA